MGVKILLVLLFCVHQISGDCKSYTKCGDCIGSNEICMWCAEEETVYERRDHKNFRCMTSSNKTDNSWCKPAFIVNPDSPKPHIKENAPFNDAVQFRPQRISIKTRPGHKNSLTMYYQPAKDYPLDVYFLMDLSHTMEDIKQILSEQANTIYKNLKTYTNNVQFGMGTFVEKPAFPLVDEYRSKVKKENNPPVYSFENRISLTTDMDKFKSTVNNITFTSNYDDPEAGLDALMQVMKCNDELKWRDKARRIIVLYTDSTYHSAGDGLSVGAYKHNDMTCHLVDNVYNINDSLAYDYPSVSQINKVAKEGSFIIIFAVANISTEYKSLASQIVGAEFARLNQTGDRSEVVELIKDIYQRKAGGIQLDRTLPKWVDLTLDPDCTKEQATTNERCKSTPDKRTVTIQADLVVNSCPKLGEDTTIKVKVVGIDESLTIDLETICACDCEKKEVSKPVSPLCNDGGFTQCGICKCNPGRTGLNCKCHGTAADDDETLTRSCKLDSADTTLCSSRGNCSCGECSCDSGFSGNVCQYDDSKCINEGKKCFGHGRCQEEKCKCDDGWSGPFCTCDDRSSSCIAPYSDKICSENGKCNCGRCACYPAPGKNESRFSGRFCEICDDCAEERCKELQAYVLCNVTNDNCDYKIFNTPHKINVTFVNKTEINGPKWGKIPQCSAELKNHSFIIFKYQSEDDVYTLAVQNESEPPPEADIWVPVGSAIGLVLLIGILTLIGWKICVDLHDKREYDRFVRELEGEEHVIQNPHYSPPTTEVLNPTFGRR